jgi:hypothetical protein
MNIRYTFYFKMNAVLLTTLLLFQMSVYAEGDSRSSAPLGAKPDQSSGHASNPVGGWAPTNWQSIRPPSFFTSTSSYRESIPDMWEIDWWPPTPLRNTSALSWEIEWVNSRPLSIDMIKIDWWSMEWSREMATFRMITPRTASYSSDYRNYQKEQKRRNDFGFSPSGGHGGGGKSSGGSSPGGS